MRFSVESWAPEFGVPADATPDTEVPTNTDVEIKGSWKPLRSAAAPASEVLFVDGVRRVDANLWIEQDGDVPVLGLCATYAAGAVRCTDRAEVVDARVERALFTSAAGAGDVETSAGTYRIHAAGGSTPEELWLRIQEQMGRLEGSVSATHAGSGLVVVDGPLSHHRHVQSAVGYVKAQHVHYLPAERRPILLELEVGTRTPLFMISGGASRFSWYVRVGHGSGPAGGQVRCEIAGNRSVDQAVEVADAVTATLPRYASTPHKDPRAPQNLFPIAGLERELRRRLGDQALMERALRRRAAGLVNAPDG